MQVKFTFLNNEKTKWIKTLWTEVSTIILVLLDLVRGTMTDGQDGRCPDLSEPRKIMSLASGLAVAGLPKVITKSH